MNFESFPTPQKKVETKQDKFAEWDNLTKGRKELYEFPETIKPGTARMLSYSLKNTIENNEKSMEKEAKENGTGVHDERKNKINMGMKMQRMLLDTELLGSNASDEIFKEMIEKGEEISPELVKQKREDFSADKMFDLIQKRIDSLEELKNNGEVNAEVLGSNIKIDELLKQASDLKQRLLAEASRDIPK